MATAAQYAREAGRVARRRGLDPVIFRRQIGQESGFDPSIRSPAGAVGIAQLMPATARSLRVNPLNPHASLRAAADLMADYVRKYGYEGALRAYNAGPGAIQKSHGYAETNAYVRSILGGRHPSAGSVSPAGGRNPLSSSGTFDLGSSTGPSVSGITADPAATQALVDALQQAKAPPPSGSLQPPAFAAHPTLPQGAQVPQGGGGPAPKTDVSGLLAALEGPAQGVALSQSDQALTGSLTGSQPLGVNVGGRGGRVVIDPHANYPGQPIHHDVIAFARQVSSIAGQPIRIGTGTRHPRLTINGTVSDHAGGEAADIPATSRRLIRLGQAALIAAGMPAAQARKQTGGGYNVGKWQVIFNTNAPGWGDHTTHLHIGRRR